MRISERKVAEIMMYRGLGYRQDEIARIVGVSQPAVHYWLKKLRKMSEKDAYGVFMKYVRRLREVIE